MAFHFVLQARNRSMGITVNNALELANQSTTTNTSYIIRLFLINTICMWFHVVLFHQIDVDPRGNNGVSTHHHHHYHHHHHHHHHHFVQPPYQVPQPQAYHPYPTPGSMVRYNKWAISANNRIKKIEKKSLTPPISQEAMSLTNLV